MSKKKIRVREKPRALKLNKCAGCKGTLYEGTFEVLPAYDGRLLLYCPLCAALVKKIDEEVKLLGQIVRKQNNPQEENTYDPL